MAKMGESSEHERKHMRETDLGDYHLVLEGMEIDALNKQKRLITKLHEDKEFRTRFEKDPRATLKQDMGIIIPKRLLPETIILSEELVRMEKGNPTSHTHHSHHNNHGNHSHVVWSVDL